MFYLSLKIVNKHNVCISPKYQDINFFEDETTLIFLGAGEEIYLHSKDSFFLAQSDESNSDPAPGKVQGNQLGIIFHWSNQVDALLINVRRFGTHQAETVLLSSFFRIFSSLWRNMLIALVIWYTVNRLLSINRWWIHSMFSSAVAVARCSNFGSTSRFYRPHLNPDVHFFTVD